MARAGWPRLSRRRFLTGGAALGMAAPLRRAGGQGGGDTTLQLLCWEGFDDPAATEGFREATGWEVAADYLSASVEVFTLLRAGGIGRYDLVSAPNGLVAALAGAGLIQPLDPTRLGNAAALFPPFQRPEWAMVAGQPYAAPLVWGTCPMMYDVSRLATPPAAWADLAAPEYEQQVVMTDDPVGHLLIWNRVRGHDDPTRVSRSELHQTADVLADLKRRQVVDFVSGVPSAVRVLASGTGWVSTTGAEAAPAMPEAAGADVRLARPAPGDWSACDAWCLAAGAPHADAAHAFVEHMLSVPAQAALVGRTGRGTVSAEAAADLDEEHRALFRYDALDEVFRVSPLFGYPPFEAADDGIATYVDWINAWDRVRVAPMAWQIEPTPTPSAAPTPSSAREAEPAPQLEWLSSPTVDVNQDGR